MAAKKKFYKKAKTEEKTKKFPSNYRIIPEKLNKDGAVFLVGILCIVAAMVLIGMDLKTNVARYSKLTKDKGQVTRELNFWEKQIKTYPNFRDAYMSLALLYYQLGDYDSAKNNLNNVFLIDPNFKKGRELEKLLSLN